MAQYFNDFTQYPLATKLDAGGYDFAVMAGRSDYVFQAEADARGASGRVLRVSRGEITGPNWWRWSAVPSVGSGEMYIEAIAGTVANGDTTARKGVLRLLCNANADATQGYFGTDSEGGGAAVIPGIRRADTPSTGAVTGTAYTFIAEKKRCLLFRWKDLGTTVELKYKTWWSDAAEPASWTVQTTNAGLGSAPYWASGFVGFGRFDSYSIATLIAFIGVGTGTDSAPRAPSGGGDTAAPTLTSPSATATGATTASGSVTTDEANGTLYYLASANATELVATVKAGSSQAVTTTGAQNVTVTDLTASTSYYLHFVHTDAAANDSTVATSAQFTTSAAGDTTPPTLTGPTVTATGATTASGTVSTNEDTGTLYWLASANASETGTAVKAGSSQAVSAVGTQNVTVSGLTASTAYYLHYLHRDAAGNDSTVATSAQFTTSAAPDTTVPTLTGSVTFASVTQTTYSAQWPAGSDNVGVTGYEYQIGGTAGAWTDAGNSLSAAITGRTAGTTETVYVRAYDAAGNRSTPAISGEVTLLSAVAGINVTEPLKNNTGTVLASQSGVRVAVLQAADLVSVFETSGLTTNASGLLAAITDAAITTGQQYHVVIKLADGSVGITGPITAS